MRSFREFRTSRTFVNCVNLVVVTCSLLPSITAFMYPPVFTDIAFSTPINATNTCTGSTCNNTCPTRTEFPSKTSLFLSSVSNSGCSYTKPASPDLPSHVSSSTGKLQFTGDTSDCNSYDVTREPEQTSFTLSVWFYANCSNDCIILDLDERASTNLKYILNGNVMRVQVLNRAESVKISKTSWHHLAIRVSGSSYSWYVDGTRVGYIDMAIPMSPIKFGPQTMQTVWSQIRRRVTRRLIRLQTVCHQDLTSSNEIIAFIDGRLYSSPLTFREILYLNTGTLMQIPGDSSCRCPDNAPIIVENTIPEKYMKCTNDNDSITVPRLNSDSHLPIYMVDNDTSTYWSTKLAVDTVIVMPLGNLYQLNQITLKGLQTIPAEIAIQLRRPPDTPSELTFKSSCGSQTGCRNYDSDISTTNTFTYTFEPDVSPTTRTSVEKITAKEVAVILRAGTGNNAVFTVSEIALHVRCHCFGNDNNCVINSNTDYTCNCESYNTGQHCEMCISEYYRDQADDLSCSLQCGCNLTGSENNVCQQVGGQCPCKTNVDSNIGRTCTTCKHNSVNLGSDPANGCKSCSCLADGITRCENNLTCSCKANVKDDATCSACKDNFYDISHASGCLPCECMLEGSEAGSICDKTSGQCQCRTNVQGRQCNQCKDGFYDLKNSWPTGCLDCNCNFVGSTSGKCNKGTGTCTCIPSQYDSKTCTPIVLDVIPKYGPLAGGTEISIHGHLLGTTASSVTFSVNDIHQSITSRSESVILVTTKSSNTMGNFSMALSWSDGNNLHIADEVSMMRFQFRENPVITTPQQKLITYASGGCSINIAGSHLDSVYQPKLMVYNTGKTQNLKTVCEDINANHMTCKTPNVTSFLTSGDLEYGFWLDGVIDFRELNAQVEVIEDPEIDSGKTITFKNTFDKEIKITGRNLQRACARNVRVTIDGKECKIKEHTNDYIICDPDEGFPGQNSEKEIKVYIGSLVLVPGMVQFKMFWVLPEVIAIIASVAIVIIALVVIFICCKLRRRGAFDSTESNDAIEMKSKDQAKNNDYTKWEVNQQDNNLENGTNIAGVFNAPDPKKKFLERLDPSVKKTVECSMIDRSNIELGKVCMHKGTKIRIISGQYRGSAATIKTLISPYPETESIPQWLNDGLNESTRLQNLVHENVLRLLGIGIDKNVYILYPEMSKRTLKDVLQSAGAPFPNPQKLDLSVQAAEGMMYMCSEGLVHRDLATRNCWVDSNDVVKIGDTSFAYDIYPDDYLYQNGRYQPVRWMAPESLRQSGFYTHRTDVWSFGVLMWEIFTNGYLPYHEIADNGSIKKYICENNYRLGKPHDCSDDIFSVIEVCNHDTSDSRPTFREIVETLTRIISPSDEGGDHLYQNQEELSQQVTSEDDLELYENTVIGNPRGVRMPGFPAPPRPPAKKNEY